MGDLDFDELDRAVNSLISKTPNQDASVAGAAQAVSPDVSPVTPPAASVPSQAPVTANVPVQPVTPAMAPQSLTGQRSSGRFMDVIHPSADMRTTSPTPQSVTPTPTPAVAQPVTPPEKSPSPQMTVESYQPDVPNLDKTTDQKTLESPFVAGAKVEKRPLGAFSTESSDMAVEISPNGEVTQPQVVSTNTSQPSTADASTPLPEELRGDLLKIESGNPEDVKIPDHVSENKPEKPAAPAFESDPTGPTSIVQQYKEQKPKSDDKPGPIYDTSVYHKAITPAGKKKSNLMWIVWILLLMAVGVGAGAIAYFYLLPLI